MFVTVEKTENQAARRRGLRQELWAYGERHDAPMGLRRRATEHAVGLLDIGLSPWNAYRAGCNLIDEEVVEAKG